MFWRMRAAEFFGDVGYAAPVLAHDLAEKVRGRIPQADVPREFWANPAVGKVEIHDVESDTEAGLDRIRVVVRWSGEMRHGIPGKKSVVKRDQSIYNHVFEVVRKSGVKSNMEQAFSSAGCAGCGAPIAVSEKERCEFCGATLTDGSRDWVLERIRPYAASLAYSGGGIRDAAAGNGAAGHAIAPPDSEFELPLIVLARVMWSDGVIDPKERETLLEIGGRRGLDAEQVETVIRSAQFKDVEIPVPEKPQQIQASLSQVVQAVMADGKVSGPERELLVDYAKRLGLAAADLKLAIRRERRRRYQEARQILRQGS
jgi:hypothetical protein